ncbi:23S rRNA (uracil(1939)-C(5))-methyltransferase RlmD [Acetivibrio mesophilus]|uniref:23S rRNA (Uracil(1939)-C(5))-methyltransferase RlmD n=1 Tax=Acetivibrio mesophilus TaxID=2487273 RepID=A0A4V1K1Z7_9FIRM|nr:23S rRNA (uracil(1939)-C(5))-methyltransferase RlmD [Acetivibrio mesophilus]RXE58529.1 23S rRNA (uracil(1939)-C(5))-methyltransferase RlmD [Acetivibrio mesophilus]
MALVKKNEVHTIDITGMTHEGQGVGRIDNFTVFVDGPIEGEKVEIKIIKVNKSYAVGKLLKVLEPSGDRTEPFCPSYKRCGGCSLQHMNYEAGLKFKTNLVRENIRRIGGLEDVVVHDAIGMEQPLNYRNKAQYPVGRYKDEVRAGFYAKKSHEIIDCLTCGIQNSVSDRVRAIVREFIMENGVTTYDEIKGEGLVRHIMTRVGFKSGEVMVVLVINGRSIPGQEKLADKLVGDIPQIKSIVLNVNRKKTNVILGDENIVVYGRDTITDYIGEFKFNISPLSFFQVNPIQTEVLYRKALEYAQLTGEETVFDLYCGIGTISLFLSKKAKMVYGVEVVEAAVNDAKENARVNGVENAEFIVGEAEEVIPQMYSRGVRADVVVVDPPRKGCDEAVLKTLVDMEPRRIVYVSCNPATLARDLKYLAEGGFEVREVQPVDMFPWTAHVETVVLMCASSKAGKC